MTSLWSRCCRKGGRLNTKTVDPVSSAVAQIACQAKSFKALAAQQDDTLYYLRSGSIGVGQANGSVVLNRNSGHRVLAKTSLLPHESSKYREDFDQRRGTSSEVEEITAIAVNVP